ncbi:hypothetical protein J7E93_12485 [Streptomyces sp. ISL-36]|uniref:hypothetical protein n=1 Tax=Streptomyces sp. ISL-36 TaxID=2819182 RepID=UPI001BEC2EAC|nr:hypothetical protein [Streptomyces sp. ISL-36]MBT2440915.1 hypothetical protein [Streptomyces sp. ISL-36]
MLRHAIAPLRRYTKASHDVVRHPRLSSDAKVLLLYVQGLPGHECGKALSEHALRLGIKGRAYQKAKEQLVVCGYFHEWRWQNDRGRWITDQLLSNVTLTREEANAARDGVDTHRPPSGPEPAVGDSGGRTVGTSLPVVEEEREETLPHPPPEEPAVVDGETAAAERVLLSLRHDHRDLHLGVREARGLAEAAAEWLRRGVSVGELRAALTSGLPGSGVRSAVGFLRHRLIEKLPAPAVRTPSAPPGALVVCKGPGDEHVFRPLGDETHCGPCRTAAAAAAPPDRTPARTVPWRTRVAEEAARG